MKKLLTAAISSLMFASPVLAADPEVKGWRTMDSLGCMMMRECTSDTTLIANMGIVEEENKFSNYDEVRDEANGLISELGKMGVGVYLADEKYFPRGHAGVYHTVSNNFFMNRSYVDDPIQFLQTLRHEAYHAAQDAMAGSIDNSSIAIIYPETDVPPAFVLMAEIAYPPSARPWEAEAKWAGATPHMTLNVLRTINRTNGRPWEDIEPTPMTQEWLEAQGYM